MVQAEEVPALGAWHRQVEEEAANLEVVQEGGTADQAAAAAEAVIFTEAEAVYKLEMAGTAVSAAAEVEGFTAQVPAPCILEMAVQAAPTVAAEAGERPGTTVRTPRQGAQEAPMAATAGVQAQNMLLPALRGPSQA